MVIFGKAFLIMSRGNIAPRKLWYMSFSFHFPQILGMQYIHGKHGELLVSLRYSTYECSTYGSTRGLSQESHQVSFILTKPYSAMKVQNCKINV